MTSHGNVLVGGEAWGQDRLWIGLWEEGEEAEGDLTGALRCSSPSQLVRQKAISSPPLNPAVLRILEQRPPKDLKSVS